MFSQKPDGTFELSSLTLSSAYSEILLETANRVVSTVQPFLNTVYPLMARDGFVVDRTAAFIIDNCTFEIQVGNRQENAKLVAVWLKHYGEESDIYQAMRHVRLMTGSTYSDPVIHHAGNLFHGNTLEWLITAQVDSPFAFVPIP